MRQFGALSIVVVGVGIARKAVIEARINENFNARCTF
jgi:hypothetical protein